jgi:hypothetical protein
MTTIAWTPIDDVWESVEDSFDGAFETVRRSTPHSAYTSIIEKANDEKPLKPRLGTESSRTGSSANGSQERSANGSQERLLSILGTLFSKMRTKFLTRQSAPLHTVLLVRQPWA